jgi:hypothetical protein
LSCPLFSPTDRADDIAFPHPARLPLGAAWRGSCQTPGHELTVLTNQELESCNLGYAQSCPRLPKERSCDAVRFVVSKQAEDRVLVQFVLESKHLPVGNGHLEFDMVSSAWRSTHPDPNIQKLADCFLEAYLARGANRLEKARRLAVPSADPV